MSKWFQVPAVQGAADTCQLVTILSSQERILAFESPEGHRFKSLGTSRLRVPGIFQAELERLLLREQEGGEFPTPHFGLRSVRWGPTVR